MKTKALISFAVTAKLICVFVFAYAKSQFFHDEAHIILGSVKVAEWPPLGIKLIPRLTICSPCIMSICCFRFPPHFAFEDRIWVLNVPFTFYHYANMSVQYTAIFHGYKNDYFQMIFFLFFFLIFAQNIDCGYTLEPPQRGGSNEYPQSMV